MFQALHHRFGASPEHLNLWTCTVGRKPSDAAQYLGDHNDVVELLKMLSTLSGAGRKRFQSMGDLQSMGADVGGPSSGTARMVKTREHPGGRPMMQASDSLDGAGVSLSARAGGLGGGRQRNTLTGGSCSGGLSGMAS